MNAQDDVESSCDVDWESGQRTGLDCQKLETFENFVREIGGSSPMSSFAHMLYRLRKRDLKVPTDGGDPQGFKKLFAETQLCTDWIALLKTATLTRLRGK